MNLLSISSNIQAVTFSALTFGENDMVQLSNTLSLDSQKMSTLDISTSSIHTKGVKYLIQALKQNTSLTSLATGALNNVSFDDLGELIQVLNVKSSIVSLNLASMRIGLGGLRELALLIQNSTSLRFLDISFMHVSLSLPSDMDVLFNSISINSSLTSLDLSCTNFGSPVGGEKLANALEQNKHLSLTSLNLNMMNLNNDGVVCIMNTLCKNETITSLDLRYNKFSSVGAKALSECIKVNKTIQHLDLSYNKIFYCKEEKDNNRLVYSHFFESLGANKSIKQLNMSVASLCMDCEDDVMSFLSKAIKQNSTLVDLNISNNCIGIKGATELANALSLNKSITKLDLDNNKIGNQGIHEIAKALSFNTTLTELIVKWNNNIDDDGQDALERIALSKGNQFILH